MSKPKESDGESVRIPWGDNRELIFLKVNNERLELSIDNKKDNKKVEFIIVDKRDEGKRARLWRTAFVYVYVVLFLLYLNWGVSEFFMLELSINWWILPAGILGIGFLVQVLDASYPSLREKCKKNKNQE